MRRGEAGSRSRFPRWLPWAGKRVLQLLAVALVVEYLLVPQLAGTRASLHLIGDIDLRWFSAGLAAELASLATFTLATRVLLPTDRPRPGLWRLLRIDLTTIAVSHSVPGGAAAGTALGYRLLRGSGVDADNATFAKLGQGAVSALVLQLLLLSSLAIAIPLHGGSPLYVTVSVGGSVVLLVVVGAAIALLRGEQRLARWAAAVTGRLPKLDAETGRRFTLELAAQLRMVLRQPRRFAASAGWSAANWLFDAAALWCCVEAFGHTLGYDGLLVPFCLANVAAWIPITPAGLGIVEGVIVPSLVGFGTPHGIALLGTIAWRLLNFWLPIPLGGAAYITLGGSPRDSSGSDSSAEETPDERSASTVHG